MATDIELLSVLCHLQLSDGTARVSFRDGEANTLRIISTMHAEAGGDIVAEVLESVSASPSGPFPVGSFINFLLADVAEVIVGGARVFARAPDATPFL